MRTTMKFHDRKIDFIRHAMSAVNEVMDKYSFAQLSDLIPHGFTDMDWGNELMYKIFYQYTDEDFEALAGMKKLKAYKLVKGKENFEVSHFNATSFVFAVASIKKLKEARVTQIAGLYCYLVKCEMEKKLKPEIKEEWEDFQKWALEQFKSHNMIQTWSEVAIQKVIVMYNKQVSK